MFIDTINHASYNATIRIYVGMKAIITYWLGLYQRSIVALY